MLGVSDSDKFMDNLYKMLLEQRLYYASYEDICNVMTQHRNSIYAGVDIEYSPFVIYLRNKNHNYVTELRLLLKV